jgi:hypothetical protein
VSQFTACGLGAVLVWKHSTLKRKRKRDEGTE